MKLNQFRYLAAIAEHGSIAKAARSLFISQPSVSQAIKELEDELGFPVLIRERQGTTFTVRGIQVLEIAQNILRELNRLDKLAGSSGGELWGNLAIGGTSVIIVVGVALETVKQMEAQMLMRHYKGFLE